MNSILKVGAVACLAIASSLLIFIEQLEFRDLVVVAGFIILAVMYWRDSNHESVKIHG